MITKDFLEKHFKHHDKLVLYKESTPLTITKEWHLRLTSGHNAMTIVDCEDLAEYSQKMNLTLHPVDADEQ